MLTISNKMPQIGSLRQFCDHSAATDNQFTLCKRDLKRHIKQVQQIQKFMFKVAKTDINFKYPKGEIDDENIKVDALWSHLDNNFGLVLPFIEETVERWNSRT